MRRSFFWMLALIALLPVIACMSAMTPARLPANNLTCSEPTMLSTGYPTVYATWITALPEAVEPGQTVRLSFEDGYVTPIYIRDCGVNHHEVSRPTLSGTRDVEILIDRVVIETITCPRRCSFDLTIPATLEPGEHTFGIAFPNIGYAGNVYQHVSDFVIE